MERVTTGEEVLTREYSVKWTVILLIFGLDELNVGILINPLNG